MKRTKTIVGLVALSLIAGAGIHHATAERDHHAEHAMDKAEHAVNPYPLSTCVVSGGKLGSMGEPYRMVFKQEIKFCCKGCVKDFKKDPLAYLAKIEAKKEAAKGEKAEMHDHGEHHNDH